MDVMMLDIPQESLVALKISRDELGMALRMAAAMKYYEMGQLSSGAAARLADYGVDTFRLTEEDLQREARLA